MERRLFNPEMDELVDGLNLRPGAAARADGDGVAATDEPAVVAPGARSAARITLDDPALREVRRGEPLGAVLEEMARRGASDLVLVPGSAPALRVGGRLECLPRPPVEGPEVERIFAPHLGARSRRLLEEDGAADLSLRLEGDGLDGGLRLRVNLQRQRGTLAAAVRALPRRVPGLDELNLPSRLAELVAAPKGLVLVCGPTGSGKSTTLAALIGVVNRTSLRHVITIEDPIEYEHTSRRSLVEQVEVGRDTPDFHHALRAALRRDPDVLLVGEMRDPETMAVAVTAAETGHLILSTLHTGEVAQAVHRVVDSFPAAQQPQIRHQLSLSLSAVVCQQLVPTRDGRRVPALEILVGTHAVRNLIRKGAVEQLANELLTGRARGMCSMEESLAALVRSGAVDADEARLRAPRLDELERRLAG